MADNDNKVPEEEKVPREPTAAASTNDEDSAAAASPKPTNSNGERSASVMMDEKAQYRRAANEERASKPGAFAAGGGTTTASAVIASVESDAMAKKLAANSSVATTSNSVISNADSQAAIRTVEADMMAKEKARNRNTSAAASTPGAVSVAGNMADADRTAAIETVEADMLAKQQARSTSSGVAPGAVAVTGTASVLSSSDASAAISTVEADLLAKEKAASGGQRTTGTTQPGAVAAGGGAASEMIAEGEAIIMAVEEDTAAKEKAGGNTGTTKPGAVAAVGGAAGAAAIITAVDQEAAAKEKAAAYEPAPPLVVMEPQVIAAIEEDQLAKLQAQQQEQPATKAEEEKLLPGPSQNDVEDKIAEMEAQEGYHEKDGAYGDDDKSIKSGPKDYEVEDMAGNNEGLLQARLVDEHAEREALEKGEVFDREKGRPYYREMWFILTVSILAALCLVGIIVGIVVGTRDDDGGTPAFTEPPTTSPTIRSTSTYEVALREWVSANHNISSVYVDYSPEAYDMAIEWYANEDEGLDRTVPVEETLWSIDRLILVWVYFHGTLLGTSPWLSCNPPNEGTDEDERCTWLVLAGASNDLQQNFYVNLPSKRWLSRAHECEWAGVTCFNRQSEVEIPGQFKEDCIYRVGSLWLNGNGLKNTLPIQVSRLQCLQILDILYNNDVTGTIPPELFGWDFKEPGGMFEWLNFQNLPKITGSIPDTVFNMKSLETLELGDMGLTGTLPNRFSELPRFLNFYVFGMDQLDFMIPTNSTTLLNVYVHRNSGLSSIQSIPTEIGNLQNLNRLWMFENNLQGELPSELSNCRNMLEFRVSDNQLTGLIPNYNWQLLQILDLQNNRLEGPLPPFLDRLPAMIPAACDLNSEFCSGLAEFYLGNNRFNGTINPDIAASCNDLQRFEIDDNEFIGAIPDLSGCPKLSSFEVNLNNFEGEVPFEMCKLLKSEGGLTFLNADCLAFPPQNECKCCTACCDSSTRVCEASVSAQVQRRRLRASENMDKGSETDNPYWEDSVRVAKRLIERHKKWKSKDTVSNSSFSSKSSY